MVECSPSVRETAVQQSHTKDLVKIGNLSTQLRVRYNIYDTTGLSNRTGYATQIP